MTWPAPLPAPQPHPPGGPHPSEWVALIREGRRFGFNRVHPSLTGAAFVYSDGQWRVEFEWLTTVAEVRISRRARTRFECFDQVAEFFVSSPVQLHAALLVFRVLPSPIGRSRMSRYMNEDAVIACADLIDRCGASEFEIGYLHDDVPVEQAGWYAVAKFQGARITAGDNASPTLAAMALSERLLAGATCRCRQPVTMSDGVEGCRWRLMGRRWEPGCDAPPVRVEGKRGDYAAMQRALAETPANRAGRRAAKRGKKGGAA